MPEAAQAEEVGRGGMYRTLLQSAGLFLVVQWGMKQFFPPPATSVTTTVGNKTVTVTSVPAFEDRAKSTEELQGEYSLIPQRIAPIWPPNTALDISIFVSPSVTPPSLNHPDPAVPVLEETNFSYGAFSEGREAHSTFAVPPIVQNNGTLWAHFFVAKSGSTLDPTQPSYNASNAYRFTRPLSQYLKQQKVVKKRNLLDSSPETPEDPEDTVPKYTSHYHPNLTLSFIPDIGVLDWTSMNPGIREWIVLESSAARDPSGQNGWYYPVLFLNTFWQLRSHMTEINSTVSTLDLNLHLNELSNWKFSILASMDYGFKEQREKAARGEKTPGGGDGSEIEMLKGILLDSNVYLLGTTVIVGILHTIFEMLAFKNDVSHWRNKKDNVGISVRTILANVFMQTVIFLYLLDNNENTSWMILMGQGMGILIEFWKITKTVDVRIRPTSAESTGIWRYLPYEIKFEDKHKLSETEKQTQEYDQIAFGYMAYLAVPLLAAYAVYSLYYESHKSWYSFVITTLVGSVYAYGFLLLLPSLYINYRLQSVAHMPGKAMTYKVLSTFIDDLFAFTIKMPTLHRLATLRDDVVFFVYLYQSWKYKVDYGRVNEFGQGGDEGEEREGEGKEGKAKVVAEGVEKTAGEVGKADQGQRKKVDGKKLIEADAKASSGARDGKSDVKRRKQ